MNPTNDDLILLVKDALVRTKITYTFENDTFIFKNWFKNTPDDLLFRIKVRNRSLIILTEHTLYCDKNESEMIKFINLINCHYTTSSLILDSARKQVINKHFISCFESTPTTSMIRNALLLSQLYFDTFRTGFSDILLGLKAEDVFHTCLTSGTKLPTNSETNFLN